MNQLFSEETKRMLDDAIKTAGTTYKTVEVIMLQGFKDNAVKYVGEIRAEKLSINFWNGEAEISGTLFDKLCFGRLEDDDESVWFVDPEFIRNSFSHILDRLERYDGMVIINSKALTYGSISNDKIKKPVVNINPICWAGYPPYTVNS